MRVSIKLTATQYAALKVLFEHGPVGATVFGAEFWRDRKRGRVISSCGGGDYAAQMFLGRLKRLGLARHAASDGSTLWELAPLGRASLAREAFERGERL